MRTGVLYIVGSFKSGGTETQLVEMLKRIDRARFEPCVICIERKGALLPDVEALGVDVREAGFKSLVSPGTLKTFRAHAAWMASRRVRIVHGFLFHGALYGALLKALRPEAKLVVSEQAIYGPRGLRHRIGRRWYYRKVDAITANCEAVRRALAARDGVDPGRIKIIYGGVDVEAFKPVPRQPNGDRPRVVGCIGRLHPDKGQTLLVRAAAEVLRRFPHTRFVLVGDGPQRGEIETLTESLGVRDSVTLLGERRDVPGLLAGMDILVLPSASEGFSNAALEGLASGIPVVASDAGGNPEIVADGEVGRIFRKGDAPDLARCLSDLLEDGERATRMGEAGRRRAVRMFPLEGMIRAHEKLYDEIASIA